jgi:adenylate kinase family enzyme
MWGNMLLDELEDNMHLVLDGAPRALSEALLMSTAFDFYKRENPVVIYLNVSRRWSEDRLLGRGRADDRSLQKINKRLDWFDRDVIPAVDFFREDPRYKFLEINGEQTIEKVHADIVNRMEN